MTFTDAHSGSSVCTPTRYGLLTGRYDQWWSDVQPLLVNESVTGIPAINPFQELYYKQFGGSPTAAALKRMDPKSSPSGVDAEAPKKRKAKAAK